MGLGVEVAAGNSYTHVCGIVVSRVPIIVIRVCAR